MKVQSKLLAYGVLSLGAALSVVMHSSAQAAPQFTWTEQEPTYVRTLPGVRDGATCKVEKIRIASDTLISETGHFYREVDGCVTHGATIDVADVSTQAARAIRIKGDTLFHDFSADSTRGYLVPGTDIFVNLAFNPDVFSRTPSVLTTYQSLAMALSAVSQNSLGIVTRYQTDQTKGTKWTVRIEDGSTHYFQTQSMVSSPNGRYILAYLDGRFYVKIDLQTGTQTITGYKVTSSYDYTPPNPLSVSNDGKYAYIGGSEDIFNFQDCGDDFITVGPQSSNTLFRSCPSRNLSQMLNDAAGYPAYSSAASFIDDDQGLLLTSHLYPGMYGYTGPSDPKTIEIHGANYIPSQRLQYLALGDSYSSGEGDIAKDVDGKSFYLPGTENDKQCHISSRSYPFLLRDRWNISTGGMKSVACSGALVTKDYMSDAVTYVGQHLETAKMNIEQKAVAQKSALDNYAPGIVPQLEFVKKNKPMAITITGGGNDLGFAKILYYCASDLAETFVYSYSCEYVEGGVLNEVLNDAIDTQYAASKKLVQAIQRESPTTKIYYVGYPSFIAGPDGKCNWNNGSLNDKERDMINKAVTRLNGVLRAVAAATGVQYVDIESSLAGGRLCEGSRYVTGVWDAGLLSNQYDQSFHPNMTGHQRIASAIIRAVPNSASAYQPESPMVKIVEPVTATYPEDMLGTDTITAGGVLRVTLKPNTLLASSDVVMTGFSTPVDLGTYASNSDGSIEISANMPKQLAPGLHVLTLQGLSPSGEAIRYYQQFAVESSDSNDSDGDGIANDKDGCSFMKSWFDEAGRDVCLIAERTGPSESTGLVTDKIADEKTGTGPTSVFPVIPNDSDFLIAGAGEGDNLLGIKINDRNGSMVQTAPHIEAAGNEKSAGPLWISALVGATLLGIITVAYLKKK